MEKIRQMTEKDVYDWKLNAIRREVMKEIEKNNEHVERGLLTKIKGLEEKLRNTVFSAAFSHCQNKSYYYIKERQIERLHSTNWVQIGHPEKCIIGEKKKVQLKIIQTKSRQIMFGVMDQRAVWANINAYQTAGAFTYYGSNGQVYHNNASQKQEGGGFNTGDLVEMEVDLAEGMLKWFVNSELKCTYTNNVLKDANKAYCPYF